MGMFDTIKSSYDLGPGYQKELQTKDLDCLMSHYWIDPLGRLFLIDEGNTADFVELTEDDPRYDPKRLFLNFIWVPNGNHGKVETYSMDEVMERAKKWSDEVLDGINLDEELDDDDD